MGGGACQQSLHRPWVFRKDRSISYSFGLAEGAYRHGGNSDGVGIVWRLEGEDEGGELYRVHWNPRDIPEHRGTSPATIALPAGHSGLVTLEVDAGPAGNGARDWAIFSGARSE